MATAGGTGCPAFAGHDKPEICVGVLADLTRNGNTPPLDSASLICTSAAKPKTKALRMDKRTTAEAIVASLIAHGIKTLYALPGVHNDHLFDALFRASDRIGVIHPRHEQGAGYMALGAALATGRPSAYAVVPGPGLLNTGAALLTAYAMNAPVLALIGQIRDADIGRGLGHLHEIRDQAGIIARLVDFSARITAPGEASGLVAEAVA